MLKYEKKLHFDKCYKMLLSNSILRRVIVILWGVIGYLFLYSLFKHILLFVSDSQPWNDFNVWFNIGSVNFIKGDLVYFVCGLVIMCYGAIRLSKITIQNHSVKNNESNRPNKLLTTGCYAQVRHPMYGAFIILQAGFMLSLRSSIGVVIALIVIVIHYANAIFEEKKQLVPIFGEKYHHYAKTVNRMLLTKTELILLIIALLISIVGYVV